MSEWYETAFDRLYPVVYCHRDEEEARRAAAAFAGLIAPAGVRARVLDLACGSGRHLIAFAAEGLEMIGLDLSGFLLERAVVENGLAGRVVQGDMRALPFRSGAYAGAINMFTSFGYFECDADHARVLDEVARVLRPGGRFLIDYVNAPVAVRVVAERARSEREASGGYTVHEDRGLEDGGRYLVKDVRVTHPREETIAYRERVRLFGPDELARMLERAGLKERGRFGDYDGGRFAPEASDRVILLCERTIERQGER